MANRPYPWPCCECGHIAVWPTNIPYDAQCLWDGVLHKFHISDLHANRCAACGDLYFDNTTDDQIQEALMQKINGPASKQD